MSSILPVFGALAAGTVILATVLKRYCKRGQNPLAPAKKEHDSDGEPEPDDEPLLEGEVDDADVQMEDDGDDDTFDPSMFDPQDLVAELEASAGGEWQACELFPV